MVYFKVLKKKLFTISCFPGQSDFMAVEMVNRRIEFAWNAGGGPQRITHPLSLLTNTPEVSDDTRW